MFTAAFVAIIFAAFATVALYILLAIMLFFVAIPSAMQSLVFVGSLLLVIFAITFILAFRKLLAMFTPYNVLVCHIRSRHMPAFDLWTPLRLEAVSGSSAT